KSVVRLARLPCARASRHAGQMPFARSDALALSYTARHDTGVPTPCSHASSSNGSPFNAILACLMSHFVMQPLRFFRCLATSSSHLAVFRSGGMSPASSGVAVGVGVTVGVTVAVFVGVAVGVAVGVSVAVLVGVLVAVSVGAAVGVLVGVSV